MSQRETFLERHWLAAVITVLVAVLVVVPVIFQYWMAPMIFEQNRQSGQEIAKQSLDSDRAVQNYQWFREQWYDIKSAREQLDNYQKQHERFHETWGDDPENWSRTAQERHGRIHDRITGQRNMISQMVADYNARASDATRAIFACGLPYSIDEKLFIADATGVEYTSQEAKKKKAPEDPSECRFSEAPGSASNTTG